MASTTLRIQAYPGQTITVFLTALAGATGTPNAGGYSATESNGFYSITITEALVGLFQWYAQVSGPTVVANGLTELVDDTSVYWGFDPVSGEGTGASVIASVDPADIQAGLTAQGYTVARAGNLDDLDAAVSSRQAESDASTRYSALLAEHSNTQADIAAIDVTTDVQAGLDANGYTSVRAGNLDDLDATVSSRQSESDALARYNALVAEHDATQATLTSVPSAATNAAAVWDRLSSLVVTSGSMGKLIVDNLNASISSLQSEATAASRHSALLAEHAATQADIAAITATLDPSDITDIAAGVWDHLTTSAVTSGSFGLLVKTNLDATVSSREAESSASSRAATTQAEHDATQVAIAALENLSTADVSGVITGLGYTSLRATGLDNLDATVSSRQSEATALTRYNTLVAEHDATQATLASFDFQADVIAGLNTAGYTSARAPKLDNLDNLTTAAPTAAAIADAVLDEALSGHQTAGTAGEAIKIARDQSVIGANNTQP